MDFLAKITVRDGRGHDGNLSDLICQVLCHDIHFQVLSFNSRLRRTNGHRIVTTRNPRAMCNSPLSVNSFQIPWTPAIWAWPPRIPSVPTSLATRDTSLPNTCS